MNRTITSSTAMLVKLATTLALAVALFVGVAGSAAAVPFNANHLTAFDGGGGGNARQIVARVQTAQPARVGVWHGHFYVGFRPE